MSCNSKVYTTLTSEAHKKGFHDLNFTGRNGRI